MSLALKVGLVYQTIGFWIPFSMVFVRLENANWGSPYPILMNELYQGRISVYHLKNCLLELQSIRIDFSTLSSYDNVCGFEPASSVGKVLRFLLGRFPCLLHHARKIDFKWLLKFENLDVYIYGAFKVTKILRLISILTIEFRSNWNQSECKRSKTRVRLW